MAALPPNLSNLSWLVGTWKTKSAGVCSYPTMQQPVGYTEELSILHTDQQPLLEYTSTTRHAQNGNPMHKERGFIRATPDGKVALVTAHNFGVSMVEEGTAAGGSAQQLELTTVSISRMSFAKDPPVTRIKRLLQLDGDTLKQTVEMETGKTSLAKHLEAVYEKAV